MLELVSSGLVSLWFKMAHVPQPINPDSLLASWNTPGLVFSAQPDPAGEATVKQYLQGLSATGLTETTQGVWVQVGYNLLANHQGTQPLPAASLTKVATSLAALETWGPAHQFDTLIGATGPIQNGVLQGDLVIQGNNDPFFVWEEAIALGNTLNRMGIRQVTGSLVITGNFAMNYETDPLLAGTLLKQGLNAQLWSEEAKAQHLNLPKGTPQPQVAIAGDVKVATLPIPKQIALLRHQSLPLAQILKQMNIYSNNPMAEMLAASVGGAPVVAAQAAKAAGVPQAEIQLINGSGLGPENQISPRAVCAMFMAIENYLKPQQMSVADLFPVSGRDGGTLEDRNIPVASVVKTGTLWDVSTLAGALPTRDRGLIWFAILNRGEDLDGLRNRQDQLLQNLLEQWGADQSVVAEIAPNSAPGSNTPLNFSAPASSSEPAATQLMGTTTAPSNPKAASPTLHQKFQLGDDRRNQILFKVQV
ncbi:D-alanyl-D-alanine carboxypeptidase [Trichocoleus sp. FACHB-591]|uniref:D-alanyl-D-alanine carboxypeptidase n=1 Tax=Trichocoleus sp. FACHB-591 TaxID=2692872 RepID=UPI001688D4C2|nr:D-alanyl-D-alanine carboxypeptidase [Trichocoleus sp. FACHB-591]